jgi:hypothetical protein
MSIKKAQGLQLAIASAFGSTKTMSAISNASEAVATLEASHGVVENDIIEITSGWKRLNKRVVRADSVATNDVTLEDVNTSSTTNFPAGEGTGTIREISTWTTITQLKREVGAGGGGFENADGTTLDDVRTQQIPIIAVGVELTFNPFWDPSLSWFTVVSAASQAGDPVPFRMTLASGEKIYGNAYWGFNDEPSVVDGLFVAQVTLRNIVQSIVYTS